MNNRLKQLFPYKSTSWYVLLALFIFIIYLTLKDGAPMPLGWDNMGYYVYLAELFVDGDLHIENLSHYQMVMDTYQNTGSLYQFIPVETDHGGFITKYTLGWSVLNAPFMYVGHLFAGWLGYPQDGFSAPYQTAAIISSLSYSLLGLVLIRRLLLKFFSENITIVLLATLVLGTNYLHLNTSSTGLSHIYIFTLYASLILLTLRFYKKKGVGIALVIGINLGLLMVVRPTEILSALIPLLYGVTTFKGLWDRILDFFRLKYYWLALLCVVIIYSFQLLYWKHTTGSYLVYTYTNPSEGLDFNKPYILEVLFSFRKGWFIYTPVMLLTIWGFIQLFKKQRVLFWGLLGFTILNLYVVSCWTVWWYAGSFSQRALEHSYPVYLLAIGFGLMNLGKSKQIIIGSFITLCIALNVFQTWQMRNGILHGYNMTKDYYISTFAQTSQPTEAQKKLLLIDRDTETFDNPEEYELIKTIHADYELPVTLSSESPYTPLIRVKYGDLTQKDHLWIKAYAVFEFENDTSDALTEATIHVCLSMQHEEQNYAWRNKEGHLSNGESVTLTKEYLTPQLRTEEDDLTIGTWLQAGSPVQVNAVYFEIYEKKIID